MFAKIVNGICSSGKAWQDMGAAIIFNDFLNMQKPLLDRVIICDHLYRTRDSIILIIAYKDMQKDSRGSVVRYVID